MVDLLRSERELLIASTVRRPRSTSRPAMEPNVIAGPIVPPGLEGAWPAGDAVQVPAA